VELTNNKSQKTTLTLASEGTGDEGLVDISTWGQVFTIASKPNHDYFSNGVQDAPADSRTNLRDGLLPDLDRTELLRRTTASGGSGMVPYIVPFLRQVSRTFGLSAIGKVLSPLATWMVALCTSGYLVLGWLTGGIVGFLSFLVLLVVVFTLIGGTDKIADFLEAVDRENHRIDDERYMSDRSVEPRSHDSISEAGIYNLGGDNPLARQRSRTASRGEYQFIASDVGTSVVESTGVAK
jgi:hypothetical protein